MRLVLGFVSSVRDRLRRAMRNDAFLFLPRRSLLHSHPHLHFRYLQSQHSMHRAHATWYPVIPLYVVCDCCPWAATDGELLALGEIPSLAAAHGSSGLSNTGITTSMPLGAPWKRWNYAASATLHIAADNAALRPTHDCGDVKNSWQSQSWWLQSVSQSMRQQRRLGEDQGSAASATHAINPGYFGIDVVYRANSALTPHRVAAMPTRSSSSACARRCGRSRATPVACSVTCAGN